jgi:hypothetical protein
MRNADQSYKYHLVASMRNADKSSRTIEVFGGENKVIQIRFGTKRTIL